MARAGAVERWRRKASGEAAYSRSRLTVTACDLDVEEAAVNRDNEGRIDGQVTVSNALIAALREINKMPYRGLHGHLERLTRGRCTLSASQLCRRISAMGIKTFRGGLRVDGLEASFKRQDDRIVINVRRARRKPCPHVLGTPPWREPERAH